MHPSITLIDGVLRNQQHPSSFEVPTANEKMLIQLGDHVKIGFEQANGQGERMWVIVTGIDKTTYEGVLDNDPVFLPMECGETVAFEARHILSIMHN